MFICRECGYGSASWMGKCPDCGQWNTLVQRKDLSEDGSSKQETQKLNIINLNKISSTPKGRKKTGLFEFDRVLGGGFVPGAVILLTGEPGVGKSTLLLQSLSQVRTLYVSGEEAAEQVHERGKRLKVKLTNLIFSDTLQVEAIIEGVKENPESYDVIVIDSVQTAYSTGVEGTAGSVSQIREVTQKMVQLAKQNKIVVILIGHVTKEGEAAGPKTLEHFVDCVLSFEGERVSHFRILRAAKNRFGSTSEIGIFEMRSGGLHEVSNPRIFLEVPGEKQVAGRAIAAVSEGGRSLFFEIQTLTVPSPLASPRRIVKGIPYNKIALLIAVAQKHLHLPLDHQDVYVNVVGGVSVTSPAVDLAVIATLYSSFKNIPLSQNTVFSGEVGLLGEVRPTVGETKIIEESRRLKFEKIYSSKSIRNIKELLRSFTAKKD